MKQINEQQPLRRTECPGHTTGSVKSADLLCGLARSVFIALHSPFLPTPGNHSACIQIASSDTSHLSMPSSHGVKHQHNKMQQCKVEKTQNQVGLESAVSQLYTGMYLSSPSRKSLQKSSQNISKPLFVTRVWNTSFHIVIG